MSVVDQTSIALANCNVADEKLKQQMKKLHLSHQHTFLPWKHLSAAHLHTIASLSTVERKAFLKDVLKLEELFPTKKSVTSTSILASSNLHRQAIFLDLLLSSLTFCWSHSFPAIKTSTFISILIDLHQNVCEVVGPLPSYQQSWLYFEKSFLRHAIERPPFSIAIFSSGDIPLISEYILATYFKHLKMYQYVYCTAYELGLQVSNSSAEAINPETTGTEMFSRESEEERKRTIKEKEEWDLDFAENYYEHSTYQLKQRKEERMRKEQEVTSDGGDDDDSLSFRDDTTDIDLLNGNTASITASLSSTQQFDPITAPAPVLVLENPEDQALFDAAMERELSQLQREFQEKLNEQQENFMKKLQEYDGNGNAIVANGGNTGFTSARSMSGSGNGAIIANAQQQPVRQKSRGK